MITGKKLLTQEEFDRYRRAVNKRLGQASITSQTTIINNVTPQENKEYFPLPDERIWRIGLANPDATTTTLIELGGDIASSAGTSGRLIDAKTIWQWGQTNATLNASAYWRTENYYWGRLPHDPVWIGYVMTGSNISAMRLWVGFTSDDVTNADDPGCLACAFRYSTGIDGNFYAVTDDGATLTAIDTGVEVVANTVYILMIKVEGGTTVKFYINGVLVHTATANLPAAATNLGWNIAWWTLEAVAKRIYLSRVGMGTN